ncbi:hypothetical protein FCOIX_8769 [Fusarium coicis]|nr:hypothetical protein FCOIX_8769 [Fusarium coicis]
MIPLIDLFINRDDHADLRDMATEIGPAWERTDDASRVKLAAFGCKILEVMWPHYPPVGKEFLELEIRELNELKGKLLRGVAPSYDWLVFGQFRRLLTQPPSVKFLRPTVRTFSARSSSSLVLMRNRFTHRGEGQDQQHTTQRGSKRSHGVGLPASSRCPALSCTKGWHAMAKGREGRCVYASLWAIWVQTGAPESSHEQL